MKSLFVLATTAMVLAASAAHAGDAAVEAPIRGMETAFNKGDVAAAKAVHVAAPTIIDEGAPYFWSGPTAFDDWISGLAKYEAAEGRTEGKVALGEPIRESVTGSAAYVVTPSTYTFKQGGKTMRETGTMSFVLAKTAAGWKIQSWTWSSPEAKPVP